MVIWYRIINKGDADDVLPDKSTGDNKLSGTSWVKQVDKYKNASTIISVRLYADGLLYHNIPLKYVTKVVILNRIYSEPRKKRKTLWQYNK